MGRCELSAHIGSAAVRDYVRVGILKVSRKGAKAQRDRWLIATRFVSIVKELTYCDDRWRRIFGRGLTLTEEMASTPTEEGCLTRLRVASVHARFYQIVDRCQVSAFGRGEVFTTEAQRTRRGKR
jgi:hypothetical protein